MYPCHPRRLGDRCRHGVRQACWHRHGKDDPVLGEPICARCYNYAGLVLWNALAPTLWRYTITYLPRTLAKLTDTSEAEVKRTVRVRFAKVAEYQRRGAIHFHAVMRLDAAPPIGCPDHLAPPPEGYDGAVKVTNSRG